MILDDEYITKDMLTKERELEKWAKLNKQS
jgi:hypothetical protein